MEKSKKSSEIITRFAPSPTGFLHVGSVRCALFNHLFTAKLGGKSILRIEDTDRERSTKAYEENIIQGLKWLGIDFDETVRQSDRLKIYREYLEKLIKDGYAYVSKEVDTLNERGTRMDKREEVIRFKNPNKKVKFQDLIRGEVEFDTTDLKDFVIAKSLTEPLYHLAVVVDDFLMKVTHIIRGEDHISNTPRQILIQEAIGAPRPTYAHIPLILAVDRSKLSKRKHGESVSVDFYKNQGYLPEAMNNFLALIGWNPGGEKEIFTLPELVEKFDIAKVQKGGAVFNILKLNWINKQYIGKLSSKVFFATFSEWMSPEYKDTTVLEKIALMTQARIEKFSDITAMKQSGDFEYYFKEPIYETKQLSWKGTSDPAATKKHLAWTLEEIKKIENKDFEVEKIKSVIWSYAEKEGKGTVLWPIRFALSGKDKSPDPFTLAAILGKVETSKRIQNALDKLS